MSNREIVNKELDSWISGETLARHTVDNYDTQVAVTRGKSGYRVLRAFMIGEGAGVSVDLQTESLEDVVEHLLAHYKL